MWVVPSLSVYSWHATHAMAGIDREGADMLYIQQAYYPNDNATLHCLIVLILGVTILGERVGNRAIIRHTYPPTQLVCTNSVQW